MYIFDVTDKVTFVLLLIATILLMYLSRETKNSKIALATLIFFVLDLIIHTVQILTLSESNSYLYSKLCFNMIIDYIFILITYLAYIWADEIEAKYYKKKIIKKSGIEWLFKQV